MEQWLYCSVIPDGCKSTYWYIADFDVKIGDYVIVPFGEDEKSRVSCIIDIQLCAKKDAPYPIDLTKHIIRKCSETDVYSFEKTQLDKIAFRFMAQERQNKKIKMRETLLKAPIFRHSFERTIQKEKEFFTSLETKKFIPDDNITDYTNVLNSATYICNAIFRGISNDVEKALNHINAKSKKKYVSTAIYEFFLNDEDEIKLILKEYPNLKAAMFLANFSRGTVTTAYSKSGYPFVTNIYSAGECDFKSDSPWLWEHLPTENEFHLSDWHIQTGERISVNYKFAYETDWNNVNYVINQSGEIRQIVSVNNSHSMFDVADNGDGTGAIVAYNGCETHIVFPSEYEGLKIVAVDFRSKSEKQKDNYNKIESMAFSEGCTLVGGFSNFKSLKKVVLPESLVTIQKRAFAGCVNLDEVVIHDNVFHMGNEAFAGCTSLAEFTLPARWQSADEGEILRNIGKRVFKDSGIRKLYVNSVHLDPKDSDILKNCRKYVIYAPKESPFFEDRLYKGYTKAYIPDSLSKLYNIVVQNNLGQESNHLWFNREKNALEHVTAKIYLTAAGLQERQNVWSLVAKGTDIKALNEQGVIMGHIRYKKDIEEIMHRYCGRIENFRFYNKEWNWSERSVREYLEAICMFDIFLEKPVSGSVDTEEKIDCANTDILTGKAIVVTGDLQNFPEYGPYPKREKFRALVEKHGGKLTGNISGKTSFLVCNDPDIGTVKIQQAKEKGVPIISEAEFLTMLEGTAQRED